MDILRISEDSELCKSSVDQGILEIERLRIYRFSTLIADFVVNQRGEIDLRRAKEVIDHFDIKGAGELDTHFPRHVKQILELFFQKNISTKIKQLNLPLANRFVEEVIKLSLKKEGELEKRDCIIAILKALFIFLRQSVGSCFATAPIILMQTNDPEFLFLDLYEFVTKGLLKRVIDGVEIKVPISIKLSKISPYDCVLMKCYEYTVASFADFKTQFYKWNMYTSLGLDTKDGGGIGRSIFSTLQEKLDDANSELEIVQKELFFVEDRYARTNEPFDGARIQILKRDFEEKKEFAEKIANFYPFLIEELLKLFPQYFQEVFDPDLEGEKGEIFEDSPAGFRLLFKHGRSDPSLWTMIYSEKEYVDALTDFFRLIEPEINFVADFKGAKNLISDIIDKVILATQEKNFYSEAFLRLKKMHGKQSSEMQSLTPFSYISGGNLDSMATCYFLLKNPLIKKEFFVNSPSDLCLQLIEYMKDLPYKEAKEFEDNPLKAVLMTNSVHAFLFRPGLSSFLAAWQDRGNSYTYIRDKMSILTFADTNWGSEFFAFVKEKNGEVKLFRKTAYDLKPLPVAWDKYFSKETPWTIWQIKKEELEIAYR